MKRTARRRPALYLWNRPETCSLPPDCGRTVSRWVGAGHPACDRYGLCLEVNDRLYDFFDDADFIARLQAATANPQWDRTDSRKSALTFLRWLLRHPAYLLPCVRWTGRRLWEMRKDLLATRGRIRTLSFFIHNFMDASALDSERIHACVFKTMTATGPVSMCPLI